MAMKPTYEELEQRICELEKKIHESGQTDESFPTERNNLTNILNSMKDGVYIVNQSYEIEYVNPALIEEFGPHAEKKCYAYFHDRGEVCPWCKNQEVFKGKTVRWEWYSFKNQRTYDLIDTPLKNPDGSLSKLEIFRDITDIKIATETLEKEREQLLSIFDSIDEIIYVSDMESHEILYANPALEKAFNRKIVGERCYRVLQNKDAPCDFCTNKIILKNKGRPYRWEYQNPLLKGDYVITDRTIKWPDGRDVRFEFAVNITERKRLEQELLKVQKLESLGHVAGGIAHDFNNLLTSIMGNITLAKMRTGAGNEVSDLLKEAETSCMQAGELTRRFLIFSKGGKPVKKAGSMARVIRDATGIALSGADVGFEFSISEDLWTVEFDEGQINQAFNNIITNAKEAMPEGGGIKVCAKNISIETGDRAPEIPLAGGKYVKISIQDQGPGIPEENLPNLFDPYFSTKERGTQKGMGLGLSTAYAIIKKHDGHIQVDSKAGAGTTVHIYLPAISAEGKAQSAERDDEDGQSSPVEYASPQRNRLHISRGKHSTEQATKNSQSTINNQQSPIQRVLVLDDEKMIRDLATKMLSRLGYEAQVAADGVEAIEMYTKAMDSGQPFDALILDLTIKGGMGGKKVMAKLLEIDPNVKALISSGYSNDPVMAEYKKYGFSGVVAKPYSMEQLKNVLHEMITGNYA